MPQTKVHALVIDDEQTVTDLVAEILRNQGWHVTEALSAEEAFALLPQQDWALVVCDVRLGEVDGFSVLRRFKKELPATKVILMTGYGTAAEALDATSFGAYDYLLKPFGVDQLESLARELMEETTVQTTRRLKAPDGSARMFDADVMLIGRSGGFIEVMKEVGRVAGTNLTVLLTGESGTGKEVVAAALHRRSARAGQPFVAVNCGAISPELIESELFGHVKGSFTGADRDRRGLWQEADRGTIFLDEISETPPAFQVKLLRTLQQGEIRRVGSNQTERVETRVIAASNRNVEEEVAAGRFREDLFYRLNAVSIKLPPLRERKEDILLLAKSFAERVYSLRPQVKFAVDALELLELYPWPGNIRELENAIVRAAAICDGTIRVKDLPERVQRHTPNEGLDSADVHHVPGETDEEWPSLAGMERSYLLKVLARTKGNKQAAARLLRIDRKRLDRMIKRHQISLQTLVSHSPNRLGFTSEPAQP